MSNNMVDKNVSDKVVWENGVTPDNDFGQTMSQPQSSFQPASQPQMMFCYKCNNVIPANSKFCPCCNIELYTTCPKCGQKYSSQYPICNQCGTNRQEYLQLQKKEQERKAAIERENRRQREIEEHRRLEEERRIKEAEEDKARQKRIEAYREQERLRPQKEAYNAENEKIMASDEYKTTYSLLSNAIETFNRKKHNFTVGLGSFFFSLLMMALLPPLGIIIMIISLFLMFLGRGDSNLEEFLKKYVSEKNGHDKNMTDYAINTYVKTPFADLSKCCVIAYRIRHGLPVNSNWH